MWEAILAWALGIGIPAVAGSVILAIAAYIKNLSWVKKLGIEKWIDKAAETAIHFAEDLGKTEELKGKDKMAKAKVEFETQLKKHGLKMTDAEKDVRLAAIFNKHKGVIENK